MAAYKFAYPNTAGAPFVLRVPTEVAGKLAVFRKPLKETKTFKLSMKPKRTTVTTEKVIKTAAKGKAKNRAKAKAKGKAGPAPDFAEAADDMDVMHDFDNAAASVLQQYEAPLEAPTEYCRMKFIELGLTKTVDCHAVADMNFPELTIDPDSAHEVKTFSGWYQLRVWMKNLLIKAHQDAKRKEEDVDDDPDLATDACVDRDPAAVGVEQLPDAEPEPQIATKHAFLAVFPACADDWRRRGGR